MNKTSIRNYRLFQLGYILFPFISFIFSLKYYRAAWFKNALWLFIVFFGFSMSFTDSIDAFAYKKSFDLAATYGNGITSFVDIFDSSVTGNVDYAKNLINYLLISFTSNYHVLFGIYGIIFGFFYSRNIAFLINQVLKKNIAPNLGLILLCSGLIGFWNINGFRFWTAAHIFIFGLINFIFFKRRFKGFLILLLSITFHLSFSLLILLFLIYRYIPKYYKLFILLILFFTIYNPLNQLSGVQNFAMKYSLNEQMSNKIELYTSHESVERNEIIHKKDSFIRQIPRYSLTIFILTIIWGLSSELRNVDNRSIQLFHFGISLGVLASIFNFIPSVGGRFFIIAQFLLLFSSLLIISERKLYLNKRTLLSNIGFLLMFVLILNNYWIIFTFSFHTLFGNYFTVLLDDSEILYSLGDLIYNNLK